MNGKRPLRSGERTLPKHVAIIMDGNGRWAKARGLPRVEGHRAGEKAVLEAVEGALELGIPYLTLFAFSTENWRRPRSEVRFLMSFNEELLRKRTQEFVEKGVRVRMMGRRAPPVPRRLLAKIEETERATAGGNRLLLTVAFNYGSRAELADAVRVAARAALKEGLDLAAMDDEDVVRQFLYCPDLPDPDLVIRTSGEMRLSNFLLWQAAYAELVFTPVLWPDFTREDLRRAVEEYLRRQRRFGGVPG